MPVTIKAANVKYKSPSTGQYVGVNSVSDNTTADQITAINAAGQQQINAVQAKGQQTIASIPVDYTNLSNEVTDLKSALILVDDDSQDVNDEVFGTPNYTVGAYIESDGTIKTDDPLLCLSDKVTVGASILIRWFYGTNDKQMRLVAFNSSNEVIQSYNKSGDNVNRNITTPANTSYVRFTYARGYADAKLIIPGSSGRTLWEPSRTGSLDDDLNTIRSNITSNSDMIQNVKSELNYYEDNVSVFAATSGYYVNNNVNVGETVNTTPVSSTSYRYQILQAKKGECLLITGTAQVDNYRLWAFTDSEYKLISKAANNSSLANGELIAPADGYLICNFNGNYSMALKKKYLKVEDSVSQNTTDISANETDITNLKNESEYFKVYGSILSVSDSGSIINTGGDIGSTVDITPVTNSSHRYQIQRVKKGETFLLTASSSSPSARIWAFTDLEYKLISHANSLADVTDLLLYAPADGYLICNFRWSASHVIRKGYLNDENSPLIGKKVAWYGDSIIQNGWWGVVSDHFSMQSTNCGVYGTRISGTDADCMCQTSRINGTYKESGKKIPDDAEYIIIGAGTNDWAQNVPLGEKAIQYNSSWEIVEDVTTFYQACHVMFRRLAEQRPNAKVIVLGTPFGKMINRSGFTNKYGLINSQGLTSLDYGDALCDIAEMWGYYAMRYGKKTGINDNNVATLLDPTSETGSHLHPTTDAAKKMFSDAALSGLSYLCSL